MFGNCAVMFHMAVVLDNLRSFALADWVVTQCDHPVQCQHDTEALVVVRRFGRATVTA